MDYWNTHRVRKQGDKILPSGTTPADIFRFPENYSLGHYGVPIDRDVLQHLRESIPMSREVCFAFVDSEFDECAKEIYESIGSPSLTMSEGWTVFIKMLEAWP